MLHKWVICPNGKSQLDCSRLQLSKYAFGLVSYFLFYGPIHCGGFRIAPYYSLVVLVLGCLHGSFHVAQHFVGVIVMSLGKNHVDYSNQLAAKGNDCLHLV